MSLADTPRSHSEGDDNPYKAPRAPIDPDSARAGDSAPRRLARLLGLVLLGAGGLVMAGGYAGLAWRASLPVRSRVFFQSMIGGGSVSMLIGRGLYQWGLPPSERPASVSTAIQVPTGVGFLIIFAFAMIGVAILIVALK